MRIDILPDIRNRSAIEIGAQRCDRNYSKSEIGSNVIPTWRQHDPATVAQTLRLARGSAADRERNTRHYLCRRVPQSNVECMKCPIRLMVSTAPIASKTN